MTKHAVSILARPEGRALQGNEKSRDLIAEVSILARPEGRALLQAKFHLMWIIEFQSSPAPKGGRYLVHH